MSAAYDNQQQARLGGTEGDQELVDQRNCRPKEHGNGHGNLLYNPCFLLLQHQHKSPFSMDDEPVVGKSNR
jgi:hypothetical protein